MLKFMKKLTILFILIFACSSIFALDSQMDVLLGGFGDFVTASGKGSYDKTMPDYTVKKTDCDYQAKYKAGGGLLGFDIFFNDFPVGLYFRGSLMGVSGVERTMKNTTETIENTEFGFNTSLNVGPVYEYDFNNYFSLCAAPALTILFMESQNQAYGSYYLNRATIDSVLGLGVSADVYAKVRYKYFVMTAGCLGAFYPYSAIESADSNNKYSTVFDNTKAVEIKPYIAVGFTFRERAASTISAAN